MNTIKVNNTDIYVFQGLDTKLTLTNRIALELKTLPKYLYFPIPLNMSNLVNLKVVDILSIIKTKKTLLFQQLFNDLKEILPPQIKISQDVIIPWLFFNGKTINELHSPDYLSESLGISDYITNNKKIHNVIKNHDKYVGAFKNTLRKFNEQTQIQDKIFEDFMELKGCETTPIKW